MRHRHPPRARAAFACVAALCVAAATASGQTEAGIARDASSQAPLACLHVSLVDSAGTAVRHAVTDSLGQFYLDAPKPGVYRVRFETYGWAPLEGPLDTLTEVDFKQRTYPVAFTDLLRIRPLDSAWFKLLPPDQRFDRRAIDSVVAPLRRFNQQLRSREEATGWKSRSIEPRSVRFRYPENLRRARTEGAAIVRFVVDSTGRARRDSWSVIKTSNKDFAKELRKFLDGRWAPSTHQGQPTCDLVQYYVGFEFDTRFPHGRMGAIGIMNE